MGAAMLKAPAWAITIEESAKLSKSINTVTALYDVKILDEKAQAWLGLAITLTEVYGSRVATAIIEAKRKPKPAAAANIAPIRPSPQAQAAADPYVSSYIPGTEAQA